MFHFRFEFSLVSTKTKYLVTSLGFEAKEVDISITGLLHVSVFIGKNNLSLVFYDESKNRNELSPIDITLPVAAYVRYEGPRIHSFTPFNFSNWMNHIWTIFCCTRKPNIRFYQGCEKYEIELVKDIIGNVNLLFVSRLVTDVLSKEILKHFNTSNLLSLGRNPFEDTCQTQRVFIQNFETIEFCDVYSLDDMLLINIQKVVFTHSISRKQFNQFVKHWIHGSNPRLQRMDLSIDKIDFLSGDVYLKGIKCMKMSEDAKREIRQKHELLEGGMVQVRREDGTPAVIATNNHRPKIHLIVLH
ncbi:hypothetical protein CRE_23091 [Caenorhabditis remanei]|uniref:Sdz-33 F-box domain-containing protein n=1 Tax=Caenorhabditis remanei TaxID=31234 RepID=E3N9F6_CAERE|nr:hypothetical protein CRE_23091 [Caenorhabditis remanei]